MKKLITFLILFMFLLSNKTIFSQPLNADFTANVYWGSVPLLVNFTDISTGNPYSYKWYFGDGDSSYLQSPSHTYTYADTFEVCLTVNKPLATGPSTKCDTIIAVPYTNLENKKVKELSDLRLSPSIITKESIISYKLTDNSNVSLEIFSMSGQRIRLLVNNNYQQKGKHQYILNRYEHNLPAGMFIIKLNVDNNIYQENLIIQ